MSWVQHNAPTLAPTLPQQHQPAQPPPPQSMQTPQSQQSPAQSHLYPYTQQQQSNANTNIYTNLSTAAAAVPTTPAATAPLASNLPPPPTGAYLSKPLNASNSSNNNTTNSNVLPTQQNTLRSQMLANGGIYQPQVQQQQQQPQPPGHIGLQQSTPASTAWPTQQSYAQQSKIMQPNAAAAANNNWSQQHNSTLYGTQTSLQQQQQQHQQNSMAPHNIWQPPDVKTAPPANHAQQPLQQQQYAHQTTYDNYFTANQPTQPLQPATAQPAPYQQPTQPQAPANANYFQPQPQPQQSQTQPAAIATEFFDNGNANKSDGWGDWDWNDNGNVIGSEALEQTTPAGGQQDQQQYQHNATQLPIQKPAHLPAPPPAAPPAPATATAPQEQPYNANIIADSFGTKTNDNWSWNLGEGANPHANTVTLEKSTTTATTTTTKVPLTLTQVPTSPAAHNRQQAAQVPRQVVSSVPLPPQKAPEFAVTEASSIAKAAGSLMAKPTTLPLPLPLPLSETTNDNYNNTATAAAPLATVSSLANSNIPNSVYVSQAKPVSRPSRQYASPPGVASPINEAMGKAITPPEAFQNEIPSMQTEAPPPTSGAPLNAAVAVVNNPPNQLPPTAITPPSNLPPPLAAVGSIAAGNPFKRAGAAQHHRNALLATAGNSSIAAPNATAAPPPPPPTDFANPQMLSNQHLVPDNSEILHENQEVLVGGGTAMPTAVPAQAITLPGASAAPEAVQQQVQQTLLAPQTQPQPQPPAPPPPNDERNQYLQTSPLSENPDEELNLEADSLPPPGLSRLVLGQPELLDVSQQRMVTGTEEPANMHREERHADGEDTSLEQVQPMATAAVAAITLNSNRNLDVIADRNLYLVPGESNVSNEQRVVTGVEMTPELNTLASPPLAPLPSAQIASGQQREIELDGENLEDQQQQQQQHQQQYQQTQQHMQQAPTLPVNSRDEPPLEGAAAVIEPPPAPAGVDSHQEGHVHHQQHSHHHHSRTKSKDLSNASTGNDESDPLTEPHHHHHHHHHQLASNVRYTTSTSNPKPRKHSSGELDRKVSERLQRSDKQRSSVDRYESDDLELDESEPYYRDGERERRRGGGGGGGSGGAYREGCVRSDHDRDEREYAKYKRRRERGERGERAERGEKRDGAVAAGEREKLRDKYYAREGGRDGGGHADKLRRSMRHSSHYEDEMLDDDDDAAGRGRAKGPARRSGARHHNEDGAGRSDRSEREYDEYNRRQRNKIRGTEKANNMDDGREARRSTYVEDERREKRRTRRTERGGNNDYDAIEQRRNRNIADKSMRSERGGGDRAERGGVDYEEYRKQSSRNARDSDLEKERAAAAATSRYDPRDPRHAAMYGYAPGAYGYDPYASYYYEQMARTNPQAYSEWYKKYYGHAAAAASAVTTTATTSAGLLGAHAAAAAAASGGALAGDHASLNSSSLAAATADGRESVHSGRSSVQNDKERYTHAYITQANEYHHQRHYRQPQQQHMLIYGHQQQLQQQQHLNSTMMSDDGVVGDVGVGIMRVTRSTSNLSQIGSSIGVIGVGVGIGGGGGGGPSAFTPYNAGGAAAYYARSDYAESRSGHLSSLRDADGVIAQTDPQRLTPRKFVNEHTIVSLGAGIIVTVKPKYTAHGGAISNVVKLQRLGGNDGTRQLFQAYPGPLVRGLTHKKTIIEFCEEQIRLGPMETTIYAKQLLVCNNYEKYRGSYTLMWNLLILLLRQNGMVVGTDIAELLLKNQQQFPYQAQTEHTHDSNSTPLSADEAEEAEQTAAAAAEQDKSDNVESLEDDQTTSSNNNNKATSKSTTITNNDPSTPSSPTPRSLTEAEVTEKFRNYLLYGNVNEALDWATDNNLWGHALFLASKVDRRSHANVMMKFANKLSLNDPLQTLYQLMSGRQPSSVTSVQDEKWGDWRPHLSMILSNTSQKPELDRKSITTLGDSLFNRGDLFAAHFCYLMAQVGFGRYQQAATQESTLQQHLPKLVLLGSSHYKSFCDFATNEAIIMTEIYEYACSLNDEKFSLVEFQPYKYLLATRLLDYGYNLRSLMYFEQIALHVQRDPSKYEPSFINKIYEFADRLKYYDPVLERIMDDQEQQNADENSNNNQLSNFEDQKWLQDLHALAVQHKIDYATPATTGYGHVSETKSQIDQQFMEINKQFNALNLQYNEIMTNAEPAAPTFYNPNTMQQQQQQQQQDAVIKQQIPNDMNTNQYNQQQPAVATDYNIPQVNAEQAADAAAAQKPIDVSDPYAYYQQQQQQYMQPDAQQQQLQQDQPQSIPYYDPNQQQQQLYQGYGGEALDVQNNAGGYDYWTQQQQQQPIQGGYGDENARPTISMPKSKSYDSDEDKQKRNQQQKGSGGNDNKNKSEQQQRGGKNEKEANKSSQQGNQNSGWFGGIWNKLSLKPKNQMILPDDKNPSIVWDPDKKRWVNTDGDEETEESFKPPPKMSDIMGPQQQQQMPAATASSAYAPPPQQQQQQQQPLQQQQPYTHAQAPLPLFDAQQQQHQYVAGAPVPAASSAPMQPPVPAPAPSPAPASAAPVSGYSALALTGGAADNAGAAKTPSLQSNMFKMQRNRTLKNSYVDVFNPSGAPMKTTENVLAPALPPAAVPSSGFFIPGAAPGAAAIAGGGGGDEDGYQQQQRQYQQQMPQQDVPQFYNPNQFGGGAY